jgi:Ca2+-binding RTX toxin-like protein
MTRPTQQRSRAPTRTLVAAVTLLTVLLLVPLAPRAEAFIYWSRGDGINRANLDGTGVDQLFVAGTGPSSDLSQFGDVAVDASHIYWTTNPMSNGTTTPSIGRANLDGTQVDQNFIELPSGGYGVQLAVDAGPAACAGTDATIAGTGRSDTLRGTKDDDVIAAGGGDDTVVGLGGDDLVCGGGGDDKLRGKGGGDELLGGGGDDDLRGGGGSNNCRGGGGSDSERGC